ncbi:hypothetical protein RSW84_30645, partial [Escherichia coli]|uniref:hypothetical protein n=1 Tax=Escherichia coli TaxID=562 RepID=UPI0028DE4C81
GAPYVPKGFAATVCRLKRVRSDGIVMFGARVRFKSASVDKPVVFHFLFRKILAAYQQGGEDDDKQPCHSQCDFEEQF